MPKVIATLKRSAGNEEVGDMWHETAIFDSGTSINEVMQWASNRAGNMADGNTAEPWTIRHRRGVNVILSVAQEPKKDESPF